MYLHGFDIPGAPSIGHGLGALGSPARPYLAYEQAVATSGRYPSDMLAAPTASQVQLQTRRSAFTGGQPVWYFKLGYIGYGGPAETQLVGNYTIEAAIEIPTAPIPGPFRITWSGADTRAITPGENTVSDRLLASTFGYAAGVPAGTTIYIRDNLTVAGNGASFTYPILGGANSGTVAPETGCQQFYSPLTTSQVMNTGDMTLPAGGAAAAAYTPMVAVIGAFTAAEVSLLIGGDSIAEWSRDVRNNGITTVGGGIFVRAAQGVNGRNVPWSDFAIGGDTAFNYSTAAVLRKFWYKYFNNAAFDFGTNDIGALSRTTAQILPNLRTIWADLKTGGLSLVDHMLVMPRTSSTGTVWQTAADQTALTNFGSGGTRDTLNTGISANIGSNGLDGIFDLSSAIEDPTDHTKWRSGAISTGTITAGSGYTNGTYNGAALSTLTGSGAGAKANITVAGGAVTAVSIGALGSQDNGHNFAVGDTLSSAAIGPGTGFVWTVAALQTLPWTPDGTHPQRYSLANATPTATSLINTRFATYVPAATLAPAN